MEILRNYKKIEPKPLYHYTDIKALSSILDSESILFRRLDLVDDVNESNVLEYPELAKYCFVSSWTDKVDDKNFWEKYKEYYSPESLVCLKLPFFPFSIRSFCESNITYKKCLDKREKCIDPSKYTISLEDIRLNPNGKKNDFGNVDLNTYHYNFSNDGEFEVFWKIQYLENIEKIKVIEEKQVIDEDNRKRFKSVVFKPYKIGIKKIKAWEWQNEYRYSISFNSQKFLDATITKKEKDVEKCVQILQENEPKFEEVYIKLHQKQLRKLEVIVGPWCSKKSFEELEKLKEKYPFLKISK